MAQPIFGSGYVACQRERHQQNIEMRVPNGEVLVAARNRTRERHDPTAHIEILAIREACAAIGSERLVGHDLYVTLEPGATHATAIANARIARLYYGAPDPKSGGVAQGPRIFSHPQCHHVPEIYDGIAADEAEQLVKGFFGGLG